MTIAVALTKTDLDQVFAEVEAARADVEAKRRAVQAAEQDAEEAKGLPEAAQRNLKNAEARLRVLKLAQADAESNDPEYAKLLKQLQAASDNYAEAERQATAVREASEALAASNAALGQWVTNARQVTAALGSSADDVAALSVTDDAEAQKRTVAEAVRNRGTELDSELDQLREPPDQRLSGAVRRLEELTLSSQQLEALEQDKTRLEGQCQTARSALEKRPPPGEVEKAQAVYEAAKTAVDEAPEVERDRRAKLTLAREELAAAEERRTAALVGKDEAERRLIEDIELAGPGVDGRVIAKAKLRYKLSDRYSLQWAVDGVPIYPDKSGDILIDTKDLTAGSYVIAVHLHREPTTQDIAND